jgi:hypothetical protein
MIKLNYLIFHNVNKNTFKIKIFNQILSIVLVAIYYIVLANIPIENNKQIVAIYLYRNQKQKPSNFFQLNEYER